MSRSVAHEAPGSGYRPDIDGLRSIAVTAVVLFHAGLTALPGGYVGVDVFFVISGYLITRQVVSGVSRGSFSFAEFYLRRARRLLPAALFTIAATLAVALIFLSPIRIVEIAKSAAAASISLSNVYFWKEAGYWADSSANQPLLHTWSLSVEEQFYLVWPLLIFALLRWLPKATLPLLIAGTAFSVVVTTYFTLRSPDAAFYLTPFRTYEFALGALCVWIERVQWRNGRLSHGARHATWLLGIGLIFFAIFTFDEHGVTFPGWRALIPTVGAVLLIVARRPLHLDALLSNAFMRYIGLRSYSIYLVHWPILVFAQEFFGELTTLMGTTCVVLTVLIAEAQYRLIERPFRIRGGHATEQQTLSHRSRRFMKHAMPALGAAVVICIASATSAWSASRPEAYASEVRAVVTLDHDRIIGERRVETNALCNAERTGALCGELADNAPNILVLGDSIAPEGFLLARELAPKANILTGEQAACPPLLELEAIAHVDQECLDFNEARLDETSRIASDIDLVVVSMRLTVDREQEISELVEWLREQVPAVAVVGMNAHYDQSAWRTVAESGSVQAAGSLLHDHLDVTATMNKDLQQAVARAGGHYIDRWNWMCDTSTCRSHIGNDISDLVMIDTAHMTRNGVFAWVRSLSDQPDVIDLFARL